MAKTASEILSALHDIEALSANEQKLVAKKLLSILSAPEWGTRIFNGEDISSIHSDANICPFCGGRHISKWGFMPDRITRRYRCNDCKKTFSRTTNSVIAHTHKDTGIWEEFILLTLKGTSLVSCAKRLGISKNTALTWRHKILAALAKDQNERTLGGIVEMDETFVRISYKGNHKKSKTFKMPRPAFHRGSDNRGKPRDKACVFCAVERGRQAFAQVVCRGLITAKLLEEILPNHLEENCLVVTDGLYAYSTYFKAAPQDHKSFKAKAKHKGIYHINNINNFHSRFKYFLAKYKGVSTKYLNNYAALFMWMENARLSAKNGEAITAEKMLEFGSYQPVKSFDAWEREPNFAPAV